MQEGLLEKAGILMSQQRYDDAEKLLGEVISADPTNDYVLYLLAEVNLQKENLNKAEEYIDSAIALYPQESRYFFLKARLYLFREKKADAEKYIRQAIGMDPYNADYFSLLAHILLIKKDYDAALDTANEALALDANHLLGLNVRSTALLKLNRKEESFNTIAEALHEDPNDAYTHSNYGWGLLEKGDVKKSLVHFTEALRNDPNSMHAKAGMIEALKARFMVYRWFLQYSFWMSNMAAKYQWAFIAGFYFGTKALQRLADSSPTLRPFLLPLIILLFVFAFSTWIITPLGNLFLRLNKYGKHLLDKEEKITSTLTGVCVLLSVLSGITYLLTANEPWLVAAFFTFTMLIPVSRLFAKPSGVFISYVSAMFVVGAIATVTAFTTGEIDTLATVYLFGLLAFQFLANYFVIRD